MTVRKVTIEGSITPSVVLARGEKRTVALTDRVQRLIDRGFVTLIEHESDAPEPEEVNNTDPIEPKLNASRDDWAAFLTGKIEFTDEDGRDDLVRLWQASQQAD